MGFACASEVPRACDAFSLADKSPLTNVLVLRMIVAPTWGLMLPLIIWAKVDWSRHEAAWAKAATMHTKYGFWRMWASWHCRNCTRWFRAHVLCAEDILPVLSPAELNISYVGILVASLLPASVKLNWYVIS